MTRHIEGPEQASLLAAQGASSILKIRLDTIREQSAMATLSVPLLKSSVSPTLSNRKNASSRCCYWIIANERNCERQCERFKAGDEMALINVGRQSICDRGNRFHSSRFLSERKQSLLVTQRREAAWSHHLQRGAMGV